MRVASLHDHVRPFSQANRGGVATKVQPRLNVCTCAFVVRSIVALTTDAARPANGLSANWAVAIKESPLLNVALSKAASTVSSVVLQTLIARPSKEKPFAPTVTPRKIGCAPRCSPSSCREPSFLGQSAVLRLRQQPDSCRQTHRESCALPCPDKRARRTGPDILMRSL